MVKAKPIFVDPLLVKVLEDFAKRNGFVKKDGRPQYRKVSYFAGKRLRDVEFQNSEILVLPPFRPKKNEKKKIYEFENL